MEEEFMAVSPTYKGNLWCTPKESFDWRLYLTELDDDPKNHIEAVDMLRTAQEDDIVEIFITSPGGRVDIADMYLAAINDSKAKIITRAIGECASAATTVFLAGDERICEEGCYFMFHNVQFGLGGDSANVFTRSKFYERLFREKFYTQMSEVLTENEMAELFERAGEVYLTAEEMSTRLKNSERKEEILERFGPGILPPPSKLTTGAEEWWDNLHGQVTSSPLGECEGEGEILISFDPADSTEGSERSGYVTLPFPETKVKSAEEFPQGDEFDITLQDGYKKTFRLSTLDSRDFDEYNLQEIHEIAFDVFCITLQATTREQALEELIDEILSGGGED